MKYLKLSEEEKEKHPSIHYTGSVKGMRKLGFWKKNDICVRCGQYIYNLSISIKSTKKKSEQKDSEKKQ